MVEDVANKKIVHDFMEISAAGINRKINEDLTKASTAKYPGYPSGEMVFTPAMTLQNPVTADDIDLKFNVTAHFWHANPFNGTRAQQEIYRMLQSAFE
jgi:hypothetical protein